MNIRKHHTDHSATVFDGAAFDRHAFDEREWQAQERAMQAERNGEATTGDDALVARYRAISRALQQPPMAPLPTNFAADLARQALAAREASEGRFERVLFRVLIAVLGLSAGVISVLYGSQWLQAIASAVPNGAGSWLGLIAACGAMHWMLERWRDHHAAD